MFILCIGERKKSDKILFFLPFYTFFWFRLFLPLISNFFHSLFFSLSLSSFFFSLLFSSFPPLLPGFLAPRLFLARNLVAQIYRICSPALGSLTKSLGNSLYTRLSILCLVRVPIRTLFRSWSLILSSKVPES